MVNEFYDSWQKKRNRVVVFAGVFDPIHIGHLSAAEDALKFGIKIVFVPEKIPQHKHSTTDYKHRIKMLQIATMSQSNMEVLDYPEDHQYIKDTFEWLREKYPNNDFVWLVGSDVVSYIEKWPDSDKLQSYGVVEILVYIRGQSNINNLPKNVYGVPVHIRKRSIKMINHQNMSSTFVLEDLLHRQSSLPVGVFDYIKKNKLYNVSDSATE
jgi:nicotinate-nucleotide adenylyltransferase